MNIDYSNSKIALNFLAIDKHDFSFTANVKPYVAPNERETDSKEEDVRTYRLPSNSVGDETDEYSAYDICLGTKAGFEPRKISSYANIYLTQYFLFTYLLTKCKAVLGCNEYFVVDDYRNKVNFVIRKTDVGDETVWLEPYFLHKTREFGFMAGFHFRVKDGQVLNNQVLQKSLSLSPDGRENTNYYVDNLKKLEEFLGLFHDKIFPLIVNEDIQFELIWPLRQLQGEALNTKTYVFANDKRDTSQFQGVKKHGPLERIPDNSVICFMYRPREKPLSYELYHALRGEKYATFPGMKSMFSFSLSKEHVMGVPLEGYEEETIRTAVERVASFAENRPVLPLILFPWTRLEWNQEGIDAYYRTKYQFLAKKLPTQFVSLQRICGRDGLKWSISNIGLAVFSKLGGKPWKLATNHERCLIIGIGQAHRRIGDNISRFFAYSVLSDSSGLYDSIRILSASENKEQYLNGLTEKIKTVIDELSEHYERFVIHTPFKLKIDEMQAIQTALERIENESGEKTFAVLKFNDNSKYFGFALNNNSKVPYESSYVPLGKRQYLVWFEGLQYHNPTIRRRIARPMHIEFVYSNKELSHDDERGYLQDAINLSGANWRGFNAKTLPISVYYAKLIAKYIREFDRLGFPEINIENLSPWFL
jgi:hypothetical protein